MMSKKNKISPIGRIIAAISSALAIIMVCGAWLKIPEIPDLPDFVEDHITTRFSLFELSDFLEVINTYAHDSTIEFIGKAFFFAALATIIFASITIILALINTNVAKPISCISAVVGIITAGFFITIVYLVNARIKNSIFIDEFDELLKVTSKPYCLVLFSLLSCICCQFKQRIKNAFVENQMAVRVDSVSKCMKCGAEIAQNSVFCGSCGAKTAEQVQGGDSAIKFCPNCGSKVSPGENFCIQCGSKCGPSN